MQAFKGLPAVARVDRGALGDLFGSGAELIRKRLYCPCQRAQLPEEARTAGHQEPVQEPVPEGDAAGSLPAIEVRVEGRDRGQVRGAPAVLVKGLK